MSANEDIKYFFEKRPYIEKNKFKSRKCNDVEKKFCIFDLLDDNKWGILKNKIVNLEKTDYKTFIQILKEIKDYLTNPSNPDIFINIDENIKLQIISTQTEIDLTYDTIDEITFINSILQKYFEKKRKREQEQPILKKSKQKKDFLPFDQARTFARSLKLLTSTDWNTWCKKNMRPENIPSVPYQTYKNKGWQNWKHWLTPHPINYVSYMEAKTATWESKIKTKEELDTWCKSGQKPKTIPDNPDIVYNNNDSIYKWYNWESFLLSRNFLIINTRSQETRQERKNRIFKKNKIVLKAKRQSKKIL